MVWSKAHAKLHTLLKNRVLLPRNSRIVMAVSGGQDSLCMARLLVDLQSYWNWRLGVVHCDHRWRDDSEATAAHVCSLASSWRIPAWCAVARSALKSEADARHWRYETFADVARTQGYDYVVCGHTMSDRAETVLYNLIRGTGIDGIATLPWLRPIDDFEPAISLVRPLLTFSRVETADFCQQQHIPVWEDSTNQSLTFRRNRIRQELLPYLRDHFNPQVERSLAQTLETTAADVAYLEAQATSIYPKVVECEQYPGEDSVPEQSLRRWKIHRDRLSREPLAMQRRVIRQVLLQVLTKSPSFQHIDKVVSLLRSPNGSQCDPLPGDYIALVCKPFILIRSIVDCDRSHKCE